MQIAKIELTQGQHAIIDAEDFARVSAFKWCYVKAGYAVRGILKRRKKLGLKNIYINIQMHRFIMNFPDDMIVDHINGDRLDNRKCNLRVATCEQNSQNLRNAKNNISGFKGVYYFKPAKKWGCSIFASGKKYFLGYFSDKKEAAKAYNDAAIRYHGKFANLNKI